MSNDAPSLRMKEQPDDANVGLPILIGVTGHRDLLPEETPNIRGAVREFLTSFRATHSATPLRVASLMAEGADLLVVEEALELGIECVALLPLPIDIYRADFTDPFSLARFERAFGRCRHQLTYPGHASIKALEGVDSQTRMEAYARGGELIAGDCFVLLALWDGKASEKLGGTASTIDFRLSRKAWLSEHRNGEPEELLPTLPVDLVYHLVVSRSTGPPATGLRPLEHGYRRSFDGPLEAQPPTHAAIIAERTAELNLALKRFANAIAEEIASNQLIGDLASTTPSLVENARLYHAIDWVASHMRRKVDFTLMLTSLLSLSMGVFFLLFGHTETHPSRYPIIGFIVSFTFLVVANRIARSGQWHRRYLEYRTLAEGLRVEVFWALAGVATRGFTPAVHRTLLKQSDPNLEWIPNAIRALSLSLKELRLSGIAGGVQFAVLRWVGTESDRGSPSEQLHYYRQASRHMSVWSDIAETVAMGATLLGLTIALLLSLESSSHSHDTWHAYLMGAMGLLPLIGGVIEALVSKTAARELQRQYEYMFNVFQAARDRLMGARCDDERRDILLLLGRAALEEHSDWLLMHRDRPIDRSRLS